MTLSAPITMPLLGQLTRSLWRVVSVVIVSPHFGCLCARPRCRSNAVKATSHEGQDNRKRERVPGAGVREKLGRHPFLPHLAAQAVSRIQANLHPALSERKAFLGVGRLHKAAGLRE